MSKQCRKTMISPNQLFVELMTKRLRAFVRIKKKCDTMAAHSRIEIKFVSGNAHKCDELRRYLNDDGSASAPFYVVGVSGAGFDLPEYQGDADYVAREKCREAARRVSGPVIVEDVSLEFVAMNGMPGPYIKWFLKSMSLEDINKMLDGFDDRSAVAKCTYAYTAGKDEDVLLFRGRARGIIVPPRGKRGFGWDPIFEMHEESLKPYRAYGKTFAEMDNTLKNSVSHRARALSRLREYLVLSNASSFASE